MNTQDNIYAAPSTVAAQPMETRATFIRKAYFHLAGALGVFALIVYGFCEAIQAAGKVDMVLGLLSGWTWLIVIGAFMAVSYVADSWSRNATSKTMQYAGLGLYVVMQSIIFTPLILMVTQYGPGYPLIAKAAAITGFLFLGLSFVAITTKKDFSFLGGILKIGGFIALGVIVLASFGALDLGVWFSVIMVGFAAASILYNTSNMIHHYRTDQYVAASLGLFASVALLLWYVIQILMSMSSSD